MPRVADRSKPNGFADGDYRLPNFQGARIANRNDRELGELESAGA